MTNPFSWLAERAATIVETLGYGGVAILIALENVFPPIPSELILPLTGFLSGQGRMWLPGAIAAATLGSVAGALLLYGVGARLGEDWLRRVVDRYGHLLTVSDKDLDRVEGWFDRHGAWAVLFGRLLPVVRSLVSVPAGVRCMPLVQFVLYTAIGSGLWNTVLIGLGWVLGDRWEMVRQYAKYGQYALLAGLLFGGIWLFRRRQERQD